MMPCHHSFDATFTLPWLFHLLTSNIKSLSLPHPSLQSNLSRSLSSSSSSSSSSSPIKNDQVKQLLLLLLPFKFHQSSTMFHTHTSSSVSLCFLVLFILLLVSSVFSSQSIQGNNSSNYLLPSESDALFRIMDSMSSDKKSWRISYPNPCNPASSWPGIECKTGPDGRFHVSRLDFGTHPYPTCKKTATFPDLIFSLPFLQSVFFFKCFTHSKTTLSVLSLIGVNSINPSSSLQQLSLRSNPALVGPIPSQISSLKSLKILTLSQNSLMGHIPFGIFSMTSLVHLDLSYNLLTGSIPFQLGNLKNLVGLDLSYNSLTGSIPPTIGQLGMLQKLDLSSNLLIGTIPNTIEKLTLLAFLALSNNKFRGNFPPGLAKLQSLQYLIMDDNPMFIPLPVEFGNLIKLQELRLANSGYSGSIPQTFSLLTNLTTLSLQNNKLTGEIPSGFGSLSHIYHLNLSGNFLDGVVPFNASFLKRLGRNLDLSGNPGLCLNPSEENNVKTIESGVAFCGSREKIGSLSSKSQAPNGFIFNPYILLIIALIAHGLHEELFLFLSFK